jgi:activating signal cointegrator 1
MKTPSTTRIISLWQPWATLWTLRVKRSETRSWALPANIDTLIVHAAARKPSKADRYYFEGLRERHNDIDNIWELIAHPVLGAAIGKIYCVRSKLITEELREVQGNFGLEVALGDWTPGRYAWEGSSYTSLLDNPILVKGRQGLWLPDDYVKSEFATRRVWLEETS